MFKFGPSNHHRNYPFRPPRRDREKAGTDWPLYRRFIMQYVWPKRWSLLLCILMVAANSNSVYLMSYYNRLVVDDILEIRNTSAASSAQADLAPRAVVGHGERKYLQPTRSRVTLKRVQGDAEESGFQLHGPSPDAGRRLLIIAIVYMSTQIILNFLARFSTRQQIIVSQGITGAMREDMHHKVLELSMSYHQSMSPGRLLSRILSDVEAVRNELMGLFISATHCTSMILTGTVVLLYTAPQMALLAIAITPLYAFMYRAKRPIIKKLNQELRHTNSCLYGLVTQKIDGMKVIQAYAREKSEILNFHRLTACFMRDALDTQKVSAALGRQANILSAMTSCAIFLYGGKMVLDGDLTLGRMMFIQSTTMTLFQPVLEFTQLTFVLQRLRIALVRVAGVLDKPVEIVDAPNAVDFPSPLRHGVEMRHVSYTYPVHHEDKDGDGSDADDILAAPPPEPVIRDVSFFVPAGEWLCIMGVSGAGKTTLLHLLSRLYEPTHGEILIDGINLKNIRMASLRHAVGIVPQEAQIFSGSMRDNICYGLPDATNRQIMDAAKAAQLHDFILEMKVQYETLIGQRGTSLSGGQRQRLSLARALLTNPELLILDDCTSALDAATEQKIQETLAHILVGKTAIMVSQRVSMAMRCHKIAVIDNGVISEYGTHHELLAKDGFYAKLFHQQTE